MKNIKKRGIGITAGIALAAGLVVAPALSASALFYHPYGTQSCTTPISFIKSTSDGYTVHDREGIVRADWENCSSQLTRKSLHPGVYTKAGIGGLDTWNTLTFQQRGCGQGS